MLGSVSYSPAIAASRGPVRSRTRFKEVNPALQAEHDACTYCGKVKYVAYRVVSIDGGVALVCFPCSDRGLNWLEQNFPFPTAAAAAETGFPPRPK